VEADGGADGILIEPVGVVDPLRPDILVRGTLTHGLRVVVRPLRLEDRAQLAEGFEGLSERSRYLRFLTGKRVLSQRGLDSLVDQVDQHDHVALAMWWLRRTRDDILLGDARFIRMPEDPATADVAVAIADEIHGRGGATLMLQVLRQRALQEGLRRFSAVMSPENEASHRMMRRVGHVLHDRLEGGVRDMVVELDPTREPWAEGWVTAGHP
jgi:RimJ/RimL family protein N-acetyltransferase